MTLTAAAALLVAGAAVLRRRRASSGPTQAGRSAPVVPGPPSDASASEAVEERWTCACGQEYRVQGEDRHRVYWLADAAISDPLLVPECPSCERPLPREHEQRETAEPGA